MLRRRKFVPIILAVVLLSVLCAWSIVWAEADVKLTILGTSDLHGRLYPWEYAIDSEDPGSGLAKVASVVKTVRAENPNTILVDDGDLIQDNMAELFNNEKVHPMVQALNEIGYQTWTLGNHEFNYGLDVLGRAIRGSKATVLAGNIYQAKGKRFVNAYKIVKMNGVRVAVIGMITPHVPRWEASDPAHFKGLTFTDPAVETKKVIAELKGKADVLIGVMHMGLDPEYGVNGSGIRAVATANPELTAIVAGHAHSDIAGETINGVLVVEPKSNGNRVSRIDLLLAKENNQWTVESRTSQNIDVAKFPADPAILAKFKPYHDRAIAEANTVIGKITANFLPERELLPGIPTAQVQDTALVDFINEVQLAYTKADVSSAALFSSGANLVQGEFKKKDVANIYKYTNTLMAVKVTGKQLKAYMEWSAQFYNQAKPGDLTVSFNQNIPGYNYDMFSGVSYEINVAAPVGKRIENLTFKGKPVTDDQTFTLAVNNYRYGGMTKDGYFNAADLVGEYGQIRDLIVDYVQKNKTISPKVDNNWRLIGYSADHPLKDEVFQKVKAGEIKIPASANGRTQNVKALNIYELCDSGALNYRIIDLLSITDFHGSLTKSGKNVGIANVVGEIKKWRSVNPNTIFVSAGDLYQGSAESNLLYGKPVVEALKEAGLVASAIGNHEYDWGAGRIAGWAKDGGFTFLAANIVAKQTQQPTSYTKPYLIVDLGGVKVGLIGLTTPETAYKTNPINVADLEFKDPASVLPEYIKEVRNQGADLVIALTHLGGVQDKSGQITGEAADLAKIPGLDGIIAGHSHNSIAGMVGKTPLVMAYYNGRTIGRLSLIVTKDKHQLVGSQVVLDNLYLRPTTLTEDPAAKAIYDKYMAQVNPILAEKLGEALVDLNHDTKGPSLMGEWVCDIMRQKTGAQIGIQNGGGLRVSLPKGDLTVGSMYSLMPFDNTLVTAKLTGAQVRVAIENGLGNDKISFGQVSGIFVTYDLSKPFGQRIVSVTLENGEPLDPNKLYTVVANDFMFSGGDNYTSLQKGQEIKDTGIPVRDAIIDYVKQNKTIKPAYRGCQKPVTEAVQQQPAA